MNVEQYKLYLNSPQWRDRKNKCLVDYDYRCHVCGCTSWRREMNVHHLHYLNVGNEHPEDIVPLCIKHHVMIHEMEGYGEKYLKILQELCNEDNWGDPPPVFVRMKELNYQRKKMEDVDGLTDDDIAELPRYEVESGWTRLSDLCKTFISE